MDAKNQKLRAIVYAEDDKVTLTAYKNRLEQAGFEVKTARDGVEAVRILTQCVPDLVILDLEMPKFNGGEVLRFLRRDARLKAVPVVTLSTNSVVDVSQDAILELADRRLLKMNCTFPVLLKTIQELVGPSLPEDSAPAKPAGDQARPPAAGWRL